MSKLFKRRYRIVLNDLGSFDCQERPAWYPFWIYMRTFQTYEKAKAFITTRKPGTVVWSSDMETKKKNHDLRSATLPNPPHPDSVATGNIDHQINELKKYNYKPLQ